MHRRTKCTSSASSRKCFWLRFVAFSGFVADVFAASESELRVCLCFGDFGGRIWRNIDDAEQIRVQVEMPSQLHAMHIQATSVFAWGALRHAAATNEDDRCLTTLVPRDMHVADGQRATVSLFVQKTGAELITLKNLKIVRHDETHVSVGDEFDAFDSHKFRPNCAHKFYISVACGKISTFEVERHIDEHERIRVEAEVPTLDGMPLRASATIEWGALRRGEKLIHMETRDVVPATKAHVGSNFGKAVIFIENTGQYLFGFDSLKVSSYGDCLLLLTNE